MERREFVENSAFGALSLSGLDRLVGAINPSAKSKDPISKIKDEIETLMEKTNSKIGFPNGDGYYNIREVNIPISDLVRLKSRLEIYAHPDFFVPGHERTMIFYGK